MLKNVIALAVAGFATLAFAQGTTPATPATPAVPATKATAPAPAVAEKRHEAPQAAEPAKAEAKHEATETKGEHAKKVKHEKKAKHERKGEATEAAPAAAPK